MEKVHKNETSTIPLRLRYPKVQCRVNKSSRLSVVQRNMTDGCGAYICHHVNYTHLFAHVRTSASCLVIHDDATDNETAIKLWPLTTKAFGNKMLKLYFE